MGRKALNVDAVDIEKFRECDFKVYNGLMTVKEMAKQLGMSEPTLKKYHDELVLRTAIYNSTHGRYVLEE